MNEMTVMSRRLLIGAAGSAALAGASFGVASAFRKDAPPDAVSVELTEAILRDEKPFLAAMRALRNATSDLQNLGDKELLPLLNDAHEASRRLSISAKVLAHDRKVAAEFPAKFLKMSEAISGVIPALQDPLSTSYARFLVWINETRAGEIRAYYDGAPIIDGPERLRFERYAVVQERFIGTVPLRSWIRQQPEL